LYGLADPWIIRPGLEIGRIEGLEDADEALHVPG
jgi:hypothetical protein